MCTQLARVCILMLCFCTGWCEAQLTIQPFGDLRWDDDITSIVQKVKRWPGITHCKMRFGMSQVDMMMLKSDEVARVPETLLGLRMGRLIDKPGVLKPKTHRDWATGREWEYSTEINPTNTRIEAGPVMIDGVPFEMSIALESEPGAILYMQRNVAKTPGEVLIPLVLSSVMLRSNSIALRERSKGIEGKLRTKYGQNYATDSNGNKVSWSGLNDTFQVQYGSGIPAKLEDLYEKYLTQLAVREGKDKPNLAGGL